MTTSLVHPQFDPAVTAILNRLYAETMAQDGGIRQQARAQGFANDGDVGFYQAMALAKMPVTPEFGAMLYILARAVGAGCIIEFGTSFGASTLFLAQAIRDNGGGRVISTELLPEKAIAAQANLEAAVLADYVEIRTGDARQTLMREEDGMIDLILLDAAKGMYLDILKMLEPQLRSGALVVSDRADLHGDDGGRAAAYLQYLSDPAHGYRIATIGTEALGQRYAHDIAVRL